MLLALVGILAFLVYSRWPARSPRSGGAAPSGTAPLTSSKLVDEQVTIKEDFFYSSIIDLNREALVTVSIDLLAGPEIEAWTMDADSFRKFEKAGKSFLGGRFNHYPDLRMVDARRETKSVRLPKGRYYVVFDNSDQGATKPPANSSEDSAQLCIVISAK